MNLRNTHGPFLPRIATALAKHINSITELRLEHRPTISNQDLEIAFVISNFPKLETLLLDGFTLRDETVCEQIAKNCQAIRYLNLRMYP